MDGDGAIAHVLGGVELRAAAFIVTIYGDVVVPRGGVLWTGNLIDICNQVGINESLVRTAVSRLVSARQLTGERIGRRSYYRLDASAHAEFAHAAEMLYSPEEPPAGWQILHAPHLTEDQARHLRLGHMGGPVYIRPDRGQPPPEGALLFASRDPDDIGRTARFWDLSSLNARYQEMQESFAPLARIADDLPGQTALILRLLLVHAYRGVLLRDPRLPAAALPAGWGGYAARDLFRQLYQGLSRNADRWIGANLEGADGHLPTQTQETQARLQGIGMR